MIAARPLAGIGVGQYLPMSPLFLSPPLAFAYGFENAHDNFMQIGAELGVGGLALVLLIVGTGALRSISALRRAPDDARLLGVAAGVTAFEATCITGHPLLLFETAFPFWMLFGLTMGLAGSVLCDAARDATAEPPARRIPTLAVAAALGLAAAALVGAARGPIMPTASRAVDGFYDWETGPDGRRFRWSERYASLFVPADVTRVLIPVRLPAKILSLGSTGVEVRIQGAERGRTLVGDRWIELNVDLPPVVPPARFNRIDLGMNVVWQPAIYIPGSADMRLVGVQVGEPRLLRE